MKVSWYDPGETRHLNQDEIAAFASGRGDQVSPLAREHYSSCEDCRKSVTSYEKYNWYGQEGGIHPFKHWSEDDTQEEPSFGRHLTHAEIAAIAGSAGDTVSPAAWDHYQECDECRHDVTRVEKQMFSGTYDPD